MTLRWQCVIVDCANPEPAASFWQAALGWRRTHTSADSGEIVLEPPEGSPEDGISPDLVFVRVPDSTPGNNRLRVDLRPTDPAAEVSRLEALGATCVDVGQSARGDASWVAMSDQEGNELCVLQPLPAGAE